MDVERRFEVLAEALVRGGHRLTPQREAVLRALAASDAHPGAEQLYLLARQHCRSTSRATVYNTLGALKQLGAVIELEFGGAGNRYDGRMTEPHAHLVCTRCGRIEDYAPTELESTLSTVAAASGYRVSGRRLDFYGECPMCQEQPRGDA